MSNIGNKKVFAKNLTHYVNKSGKDQKVIAEDIGVAPSTFNEWVKAKKYPRIDKIEMLANYFGVFMSDLIEDSTQKENPDQLELTGREMALLEMFRRFPEIQQDSLILLVEKFEAVPEASRESALEAFQGMLKMLQIL